MISFIGAGPGDPELLTIKGKRLIDDADVIIYAGSLVNPKVLSDHKEGAKIYNSALMDLDEVMRTQARSASACTPATPPSTGPTGSRWTGWTSSGYLTR